MTAVRRLHRSLDDHNKALLQGAQGPEAGAFLRPPLDTEPMADKHAKLAVCLRLRVDKPLQLGQETCCNQATTTGAKCGARASVHHALTCQCGGGVLQRHDDIRDAIAAWLPNGQTEQAVPKWDKPDKKAILDVAYTNHQGHETFVDTSIVAAAPMGPEAVKALQRRESSKHTRYPGPGLVPFAIDVRGRWGKEAQAWARATARHFFGEEAVDKLHELRYAVSQALQVGTAEQFLRSMGVPRGSRS